MGVYISFIGSIASVVSLILIGNEDMPILRTIIPYIALFSLLLTLVLEIRKWNRNKPKRFDRDGNIDYMRKIISQEGRVVVVAGNLSWVEKDDIKNAMIAKKDDLHLCVKHTARHIDEFKKAGIHVYTYGDTDFSPKTHFTVMRQGTPNERLAITSVIDDKERHVYEIPKNSKDFKDSWIAYAAEDMFRLIQILNSKG